MAERGEGSGPPRRTLGDYAYQQGPKHYNSIVIPPFSNKVVELKPTLLSLIGSHPFAGMDPEDPYTHLSTFMELCSTMGASDEDAEAVYLRVFPFSLAGKAKTWLLSHPNKSLNTWEEMEEKFIARFFPPSRFISAKSAIATFSQGSDEPLGETWERFEALLRRCPNHNFDDDAHLHIFYIDLKPETKMILDALAGGTMMSKSLEEAIVIINSIAASDYQSHHDRASTQRKGIMELDTQSAILTQNKLLKQKIEALTKQIGQLP
ncbi:hypothetical protein JHK86_015986 [Glycine max]|nr:hypothetical protein JHK86_015986 [Glycine max]